MTCVLVLGHTGRLGASVYSSLEKSQLHQVLGFSKTKISLPNVPSPNLNSLSAILTTYQPSIIVNCVGEHKRKKLFLSSNVNFTLQVVSMIFDIYTQTKLPLFIHISSIGALCPYHSSFSLLKLNSYESSKYIGERLLFLYSQFSSGNVLVLRPSTIIAPDSPFLLRLFLVFLFSPFNLVSKSYIIPSISLSRLTRYICTCISDASIFQSSSAIHTYPISRSYSISFFHRFFARKYFIYRFISKFKFTFPYFKYLPAVRLTCSL